MRKLFKRIVAYILIFMTLISSIGPASVVYAAPTPLKDYTGQAAQITVGYTNGDTGFQEAQGGTELPWFETDNGVALPFKISGQDNDSDVFYVPMLGEEFSFFMRTEIMYVDDSGNIKHAEMLPNTDPMTINPQAFVPLQRDVEYFIVISGKTLDEVKAESSYNKVELTKKAESDVQHVRPTSSGTPTTPTTPGTPTTPTTPIPVSSGNGTLFDPFRIDGDTIVNYTFMPFYFYINNVGLTGTYLVEADTANSTVTYKYVSARRDVGFMREHMTDPAYVQYGANTIDLLNSPLKPKYEIIELQDEERMPFELANGYRDNQVSTDLPFPLAYVFVNNDSNPKIVYSFEKVNDDAVMDEKAGFIEWILTRFLLAVGTVFQLLFQLIVGKEVTITSIIFNGFNDTIIGFFGGTGGSLGSRVSIVINYWYKVFRYLALIFYIIMLVYVGIKVLLASTAEEKGKYKESINAWLIGLLILFFLPYALKYVVVINNALVKEIGKNREQLYTYLNMADIKKIEMNEDNYAGGDSFTVNIEELKKEEAGLQAEIDETSQEIGLAQHYIDSTIDGFCNQVWSICGYDTANKVEILMRYIKDGLLMKHYKEWTPEYEEEYQKKLDEIVLALQPRMTMSKASLESVCFKTIKEKIVELTELEDKIEVVKMKIAIQESKTDLMGTMLLKAGETGRLVYVLVWLVLFWQLIFILILYYKRIFMIAFLIIIFPLVMITYVKDKVNDGKSQVFSTWFREYFVNIMVQFFHAVAYVVLVEAGLKIYQANHNNWLFFVLALTALFPVERILRSIFGLSASTLSSLDKTISKGFAFVGSAVAIGSAFRGSKEERTRNKADKLRSKQQKEAERKARELTQTSAGALSGAAGSATGAAAGGGSTASSGVRNRPGTGVGSTIKGVMESSYAKGQELRNKTRKITSKIGRISGAVLGATAGLAGADDLGDIAVGTRTGASVGESVVNTAGSIGTHVANKISAVSDNRAIKRGSLDSDLGIESGYSEENKQRIRNAIARGNRKARTSGEAVGEASAWGGEKNIGHTNINKKNTMPNLDETLEITEEDE